MLGVTGLYWTVLGGAGLYLAVLGCTWLYLAVLGGIGLYWEVLDLSLSISSQAFSKDRTSSFVYIFSSQTSIRGRAHIT